MPVYPRPPGKERDIAYRIMGVPDNLRDRKTNEELEIDDRLVFEEIDRVK